MKKEGEVRLSYGEKERWGEDRSGEKGRRGEERIIVVKKEGEERLGDDKKKRREKAWQCKRGKEGMLGMEMRGAAWRWCTVHQQMSKERHQWRGAVRDGAMEQKGEREDEQPIRGNGKREDKQSKRGWGKKWTRRGVFNRIIRQYLILLLILRVPSVILFISDDKDCYHYSLSKLD